MTDAPRPDPRSLRAVMNHLNKVIDEGEAREQHSIVQTDPATGTKAVIGPFPDRQSSQHATFLLMIRWARQVGEPMATFETVVSYPVDAALLPPSGSADAAEGAS